MDGYCMVKEVNKAKDIFNAMTLREVPANVCSYNIMINGFFKIKMVEEAITLFKEMHCRKIIPDTITYSSLIDGLCKSGRISYHLELLDEICDRGQLPNIITYNSILDALCKNRQVDKAIALLTKFKEHSIQPMCIHTLFLSRDCQSGRLEDAENVFEDLLLKGYTVMIQVFCDKKACLMRRWHCCQK
ncbi:hypothetical protein KIW84_058145 [Lathyrus oleraceus]|uniref:Pentatricopeptide repeat-containing protein n=1 Tax=Pisum sativum TaxID=3888 RepID=A0A9D4X811_PEA|nr:hypothetical protein KIW84_058145 [Pisum sativum]